MREYKKSKATQKSYQAIKMQENWLPLNQIFKAATAFAEFFVYETKCVAPKIKIKVIFKKIL